MLDEVGSTLAAAVLVALLSGGAAPAVAEKIGWSPGWDNLNEPLNYTKSSVQWSVNASTSKLTVTYTLAQATPNKLYQTTLFLFNACPHPPKTFGQYYETADYSCQPVTRQNATFSTASVEFGVILTDRHGNGKTTVTIGLVGQGSYAAEFAIDDGAGCDVIGGNGTNACPIDFQAPGPTFGDTATITIP